MEQIQKQVVRQRRPETIEDLPLVVDESELDADVDKLLGKIALLLTD